MDPYILGLLASEAGCFGHFTPKHPVCAGCPVQTGCLSTFAQQAAYVAQRVEELRLKREEIQRRAEEAATARIRAIQRDTKDELDSFLKDIEDPPAPVKPAPTGKKAPPAPAKDGVSITSTVNAVCHKCGGKIPAKTAAIYTAGVGLRHPECQ